MKSTTEKLNFSVPLSFEAHSIAQGLVSEISNQEKRQQVYLNSLSVYAVNYYLRCMGFETDYSEGDSRNPFAVQLMNVADLIVKDIGKLECIPVLAEAEVGEIPPEFQDRIGYVFVELSDSLKEANILGFTPQAADKISFSLNKLESLEDFLVYLTELEVVESVQAETTSHVISFRQWLDGVIDTSWQKLDELLKPQQLGLAFKNEVSITRGQKIDLGMHLDKISVALVMKVISESKSEEVDILTQLYPVGEMSLPSGIKLIIGDETGEALEVVSREDDNWIQSEFSAESGERFNITVAYGDSEVKKEFEV